MPWELHYKTDEFIIQPLTYQDYFTVIASADDLVLVFSCNCKLKGVSMGLWCCLVLALTQHTLDQGNNWENYQ